MVFWSCLIRDGPFHKKCNVEKRPLYSSTEGKLEGAVGNCKRAIKVGRRMQRGDVDSQQVLSSCSRPTQPQLPSRASIEQERNRLHVLQMRERCVLWRGEVASAVLFSDFYYFNSSWNFYSNCNLYWCLLAIVQHIQIWKAFLCEKCCSGNVNCWFFSGSLIFYLWFDF